MTKESQQLIASVLAGDNDACERVVKLYSDYVRGILCSITRLGPAELDDLQQEVFLRVFTKLSSFRQTSEFSSWVYSIARHVAFDYLRKLKVKRDSLLGFDKYLSLIGAGYSFVFTNEMDVEERVILKEKIAHVLDMLTEDERDLVQWRMQGYMYKEIEKICGVSHNTLKVRMFRLRARLIRKGVTL